MPPVEEGSHDAAGAKNPCSARITRATAGHLLPPPPESHGPPAPCTVLDRLVNLPAPSVLHARGDAVAPHRLTLDVFFDLSLIHI